MRKRGDFITKGKTAAIARTNYKINKYISSQKGREEMNTIISAYITFNTEEGHDEA